MPIITVTGLPTDTPQAVLQEVEKRITETVLAMKVLGIDESHMAFRFQPDMRQRSLGSDIFVDAVLFNEPERTPKVRTEFAERIEDAIHGFFPDSWVEVLVWPFEKSWGFSLQEPLKRVG